MTLDVLIGDVVVLDILGHSANNGAPMPGGATIALTSNDPTVATVPESVTVPADGAQSVTDIPVTVLAKGSTDIHAALTAPDGTVYEATASLVVSEPVPGLARIELVLRVVAAPPA